MGLPLGKIEFNFPADFVAIDLEHDTLAGATEDALLASVLLSGGPDLVKDVWIGGRRVMMDGRHKEEETIRKNFLSAMRSLWS